MRLRLSWRLRKRLRRAKHDLKLGGAVFVMAILGGTAPLLIERAAGSTAEAALVSPRPNLRVVDGDTLENRDTGERIRIPHIDTPEIGEGARCAAELRHGLAAKARVRALLAGAERVEVRPSGEVDRYGRTLAAVRVDGRDLGQALISEGLARPWRGRREPWCGPGGALLG